MKKLDVKKKTTITVIASIILFFIGTRFVEPVMNWIVTNVDDRYAMYNLNNLQDANFINSILRMFFFLLFAFIYERIEMPDKKTIFDLSMMMVLIGSINTGAVGRVYEYYAIGMYTIMGVALRAFDQRNKFFASVITQEAFFSMA